MGFHVFLDKPCYTTVTYQNNEQAKFGYAERLFSLLKGPAQICVEDPTRVSMSVTGQDLLGSGNIAPGHAL